MHHGLRDSWMEKYRAVVGNCATIAEPWKFLMNNLTSYDTKSLFYAINNFKIAFSRGVYIVEILKVYY